MGVQSVELAGKIVFLFLTTFTSVSNRGSKCILLNNSAKWNCLRCSCICCLDT